MSVNLLILSGKITVTVYDASDADKTQQIYQTQFRCNTCKHCATCLDDGGMAQCKFVAYLTKKIPCATYHLKNAQPVVKINLYKPTATDINKTQNTIERAIRLRVIGALKSELGKKK